VIFEKLYASLFQNSLSNGLDVALFKEPYSNDVYFLDGHLSKQCWPIKTNHFYFFISPFCFGDNAFHLTPKSVYINGKILLGEAASINECKPSTPHVIYDYPGNVLSKQQYIDYVNKAKKFISDGDAEKVVCARMEAHAIPKGYDVMKHFFKLCESQHGAFCYLISSALTGTWIAATPELLLENKGDNYRSMSLAGTMKAQQSDDKTWTEKETDEQKIVTDYIFAKLKDAGAQHIAISALQTKNAGNVQHLCTEIKWRHHHHALHHILSSINPTPAVCGKPMPEAHDFIRNHEGFERKYYSGFVGFHHTQQTSLYVNLRCAALAQNELLLFAGAGITTQSDADAEWEETVSKMNLHKQIIDLH
jgi:isochorismate synthase